MGLGQPCGVSRLIMCCAWRLLSAPAPYKSQNLHTYHTRALCALDFEHRVVRYLLFWNTSARIVHSRWRCSLAARWATKRPPRCFQRTQKTQAVKAS